MELKQNLFISDVENDGGRSDDMEEVPEQDEVFGLALPVRPGRPKAVTTRRILSTQTTSACLHLIHEALYKHQWERATSFFTSYVQSMESKSATELIKVPEVMWRLGNEILLNHPKSMPEDMNVFNETLKNIGVKCYLPETFSKRAMQAAIAPSSPASSRSSSPPPSSSSSFFIFLLLHLPRPPSSSSFLVLLPRPPSSSSFLVLLPPVTTRRILSTQTTSACLHLIHEALYKHQWERATSFFTSYVQSMESKSATELIKVPEVMWRLGNEILLNHPKSMPEDMNVFNETLKNIGVKCYLPISLEQVYFLLCRGQTEEAYRTLTVAESWRYGNISIFQNELVMLVQAHKAVLDCQSWMDKRSAMAKSEMDYSSQSSTTKDLRGFCRQASMSFREILQRPGVWDPFVLSYVNLLENSGKEEKAENVLTEYAYNNTNPANPNAHVYLYEFKKRRGDSDEELIKVLKILHILVPSHKLMLDYSRLLRNSESDEHHQLALQVLFDLLDFSGWKDNVKAWNHLAKQLRSRLKCGQTSWISEAWTSRSDWWPSYHFTQFQMKKDWSNCMELAVKKASVSVLLQGQECSYFSSVYHLGNDEQRKVLDRVIKVL
ncbi:PREDICTED: TATA box-binding protein-associated factor RNA polymerase I subunit A [Nanorana parkeri]|uniref:TATA box-binding protein-associated factor RNA polymerase I subunit A n=1 Tax=Nanorana parkeri TaxID=125878 RepID=UPI000854A85A|nr:PREDICTED: TATA box-binding protein-associated factor RNA polymerase I subunit A [Nanorana parkeri]